MSDAALNDRQLARFSRIGNAFRDHRSGSAADEVVQFLEAVSSLKSRAALTTAYAVGLRASEVAGLRIEDIDSARGVIQVRHGKGAKDRNVIPSPQLLGILRSAAVLSIPWS